MNLWSGCLDTLLTFVLLMGPTNSCLAVGTHQERSVIGKGMLPTSESQFPSAIDMGVSKHPIQPDGSLLDVSNVPLPTNVWWDNLVLGGGGNTIAPLPYLVQAKPQGMEICYPGFVTTENYVLSVFLPNIRLTVKESLLGRRVVNHDDFSVTMEWKSSDTSGSIKAIIVQGSPYITFVIDGLTPVLSTLHALLSPNHSTTEGTRFKISLNNGQSWLIHTSKRVGFVFEGPNDAVKATNTFNGVIRMSFIPSDEAEGVLDANQYVYPTGGRAGLSFKDGHGIIEHEYDTSSFGDGSGDLLIMALPHHIDAGVSGDKTLGGEFRTIKGPMTGILGKSWVISEALPTISWTATNPIDEDKLKDVRNALKEDQDLSPYAQDPYFFGKEVAAMARLALIADELEEHTISERIRSKLRSHLEEWFDSRNVNPLVYDDTWGGIVSLNSMKNVHADFGNAAYNDHHYHYGYFVYAAAVVGKEHPKWLENYTPAVMDLVRDYANPDREDPYFVFCRHKDMYAWHSWAGGVFSAPDAKNQESTSEAVNGYYAVYLLGLALHNDNLANFGRILMQMEIRSARKYWQVTSTEVYPEPYANTTVVGVLWSTKVDHTTWFGANLEYIHGIQYLPVTPISEELLSAEWIIKSYPVVSQAIFRDNPPIGEDWLGYIYMVHAIINPSAAWPQVQTLQSFLGGNTRTNTLYWVATRPKVNYALNYSPPPPGAIRVNFARTNPGSSPGSTQSTHKATSGGVRHILSLSIIFPFLMALRLM